MSALKTVSLAIDLAQTQRDQARAFWQQVQQAHQFALDQMAQLDTYANETEAKWLKTAQVMVSPELMRHHYQFMARLNQAIVLQKDVLANSSLKVAAAQQKTVAAEVRLASLKQFLSTRQARLQAQQQRRDQKASDEFASLKSRRRTDDDVPEEDV